MKVKKHEFLRLGTNDQVQLLLELGTEIASRVYLYYVIKLFYIFDFYIEIWYRQNGNRIDKVECVEINDIIHLYERDIDISDLFNNNQ